jgi:hypothetical protein
MSTALIVVTMPNIVRDADGNYLRKRGLIARELIVQTEYTHVTRRHLANLCKETILSAGIVPQAIRQVDVYVKGQHIVSLCPKFDRCPLCGLASCDGCAVDCETIIAGDSLACPDCGSLDCELHADTDYAASLHDMAEELFASLPTLGGNDPIRDMLRDFRPIANIFQREAIGDAACDAIARCGKENTSPAIEQALARVTF